jgi:hypothetical protein
VRSVLLLLASLCLLGAGSPRAHGQTIESRDLQLAAASPGLPAKVAPRRFAADPTGSRDRRDAARDSGTPLFVVTPAVRPLVDPPRVPLPGAPGQPYLVVAAAVPSRSSRGPPG